MPEGAQSKPRGSVGFFVGANPASGFLDSGAEKPLAAQPGEHVQAGSHWHEGCSEFASEIRKGGIYD
jgi:hypothetical protein